MKVIIINGSPKSRKNTSGAISEALRERLGETAVCVLFNAATQDKHELLEAAADSRALVCVFPLYVDGIPSHLLRLLDEIRGDIASTAPGAMLYAVVNNGFYEGRQNIPALEMMRNFCEAAGLDWGQGLGVGAGPMIGSAPIGAGPLKNLGMALDMLADNILTGKSAENHCFNPNAPRFLYKLTGDRAWPVHARKRGVSKKQLYARR